MWSPKPALRAAGLVLALGAPAFLAACTAAPVYAPGATRLAIAIEAPVNRDEQIATRALAQRLDFTTGADAPVLALTISVRNAEFGLSNVARPVGEREVTATISFTVTDPASGDVIARGSRIGRATMFQSPQILANDQALAAARERAITAAAEALRLALLSQFGVE